MTEVMVLNVVYDGYYGASVDETVILPTEINGVLFESLQEKDYKSAVYLGEIEGKHSECYGDLSVEFVNLDDLSIRQVTNLIEKSNIGEFESYFEGQEETFQYDYEEEYDEEKVNSVMKLFNTEPKKWSIKTELVHSKFIDQLKNKYIKSFKTISLLENDYDNAMSVLHNSEIETFE